MNVEFPMDCYLIENEKIFDTIPPSLCLDIAVQNHRQCRLYMPGLCLLASNDIVVIGWQLVIT